MTDDAPDSAVYDRDDDGQFAAKYEVEEYADLYDEYSNWVSNTIDKQRTITRLQAGLRAWLHWCEANDVDPLETTPDDVRSYIKAIRGQAEHTISRRFSTVSKYCHYLLTDPDHDPAFTENPTSKINLKRDFEIHGTTKYISVLHRDDRDDIIALPKETIQKLLNEDVVPSSRPAYRTRDYLICALAWQTGLRADELARVRIDNTDRFNFERQEIKIRSSKLDPEKHDRHKELAKRRVWWEDDLNIYLRRWIDSHRERTQYGTPAEYNESGRFPADRNYNPYLFPGTPEDGEQYGHLTSSYISRQIKRTAANAGIQEPLIRNMNGEVDQWLVTAHRLRHSRITYLANETDMDLNALRMMAGHVDFDTTLGYVKGDWDVAREEFRKATS